MRRAIGIALALSMLVPFLALADQAQDKKAILDTFSSLADKNPAVLSGAVFAIGDAYMRDNKQDEAIAIYEKAQSILGENEDFLSRLGNLYNMKMQYDKAAKIYEKLLASRPDNSWYAQMLATSLNATGKKDDAAGIWKKMINEKPKDASVMSQAASFYSSTGDMDQALTLIEKAVQIDPNNIGYLQTQANFYVRANKMDKAEAAYKAILQNAKEAWLKDWANGELLNIYQKQNKLGDVIKTYEADLNNSGNDISAYKKLGELYIRKGDGAKALEVYEKASEIAPDDRVITNRLVDMYDMNNKPAEAAALVEKLFKANPNETYLQERLAGLYDRAGKKEDAKRIWQGLLVQSKDAMMFSRYAELLYRSGDAEGAMAQLKKAEELDPNNPSFSMRRGQMLLDGGKKDEAKAVFAKVASSAKDEWAKNDAKRRVDDIEAMGKAPKVTEVRPSVPAVEVKGEPGKPVPVVASPAAPVAVSPAAPAAAVSPAAPAAAAGPAAPAPAASQPPAADTKK